MVHFLSLTCPAYRGISEMRGTSTPLLDLDLARALDLRNSSYVLLNTFKQPAAPQRPDNFLPWLI
jgi:hypothetical protein